MVGELFGAAADFTDTIGNCADMATAFSYIADACNQASGCRHHTVNGGFRAAE